MKQIMNKLKEIEDTYERVDIVDAYMVFGKACQKVYNNYIKADKIVLKHFINDEILNSEALELTSRFFRRYYKEDLQV